MYQKVIVRILVFLTVLFLFPNFLWAEKDPEEKQIKIACLKHKTFPNKDNKVKITGAIELRSTSTDFGGLSALLVTKDFKKTYLVTDRAHFIEADVIMNPKQKNITCLKNASSRPLRGRSTNPLYGHYADSEGISFDKGYKKVLISFERHHRVVTYGLAGRKLLPLKDYQPFDRKKHLPFNESYESVLRTQDNSIIAFPEHYEIEKKVLRGFRLMPDGKVVQNIHLRRHKDFWLTDIAQLSNGDFITLERSFSIFQGMAVQMRHIKRDDFLSGKVADGKVIFTMRPGDGVDNFEGLDVVYGKNGMHYLYMTSDNNFTTLQKTLLLSLQYKLDKS